MKTKVIVWSAVGHGERKISAETLLNSWLSENPNIKIVNVTQSEKGDVIANHTITYTIWYEEVEGE